MSRLGSPDHPRFIDIAHTRLKRPYRTDFAWPGHGGYRRYAAAHSEAAALLNLFGRTGANVGRLHSRIEFLSILTLLPWSVRTLAPSTKRHVIISSCRC